MPVKTDLISQYEQLHKEGKFAGLSVLEHAERIGSLIRETDSRSVLDYGCGKGHQYSLYGINNDWNIESLRLYDPAVPGFTNKPEPADGVICCDVMEHVPEPEVPAVIVKVLKLAKKFAYFVICTRPSKKTLPDGRNCHLTIQPQEWWDNAIERERKRLGSGARIVIVTEYRNDR